MASVPSTRPAPNDLDLVVYLIQSEALSFETLLDAYEPIFTAVIRKHRIPDSEDLRQEMAIALWKATKAYRAAETSQFAPWAAKFLHDALVDFVRHNLTYTQQMHRQTVPLMEHDRLVETEPEIVRRLDYGRAKDRMTATERRMLDCVEAGYSVRAAARALSISHRTARTTLNHIRTKLQGV
ncbi:MAG: sigma-70 family RNA polymerase sigma factor [Actinomycetia bacterium]|nr:sigma-70 family RNA polymerase sigma factor [Actinomycetes bacterium]